MGYFSNGTEGEMYQQQYCDRCIHGNGGCAVWTAHLLRNYDECNNKDSILHMLIPKESGTADDGLPYFGNAQCRMFVAAGDSQEGKGTAS